MESKTINLDNSAEELYSQLGGVEVRKLQKLDFTGSDRLEEGLAFLDWLWATRDDCIAWTRAFYGKPGLNVPMTADLQNHQIGGWRQYTHSSTTAAWLAQHFYWHWQFSGDRRFLQERTLER